MVSLTIADALRVRLERQTIWFLHEKIIIGVATKGRMVASMLNSSVNSIFHIVGENIEIRH